MRQKKKLAVFSNLTIDFENSKKPIEMAFKNIFNGVQIRETCKIADTLLKIYKN